MKTKSLIIMFGITSVLIIYCLICYNLLIKKVELDTKNYIMSYFNTYNSDISSYEFVSTTSKGKNLLQVLVKAQDKYYTFYFKIDKQNYKILNVSLDRQN